MLDFPSTAEFLTSSCKLSPHSGAPLVFCWFLQSKGLLLYSLEFILKLGASPGHRHKILDCCINKQGNWIWSITEGLALSSMKVFPKFETG